jgi:type II secretory pathway pseudopilin PulG
MNKAGAEKGMSILESVVVVGLVALLSAVLMDIFIAHGRIFNLSSANSDFGLQAAEAMEAVGKNIRVADKTLAARTINSENFTAASDTLIVEIPSVDSSGQVISGKYDYAAVYFSGGKIFLSQQADTASSRPTSKRSLSDSVSSLRFICDNSNYDNVGSVLVQIVLSKNISGKTQTYTINKNFVLENR